MMDMTTFALWKFKNIEGVMKYVRSGDVTTTHYENGNAKGTIKYDLETKIATVSIKSYVKEYPFDRLVAGLKALGLYAERTENRHSSSYPATQE